MKKLKFNQEIKEIETMIEEIINDCTYPANSIMNACKIILEELGYEVWIDSNNTIHYNTKFEKHTLNLNDKLELRKNNHLNLTRRFNLDMVNTHNCSSKPNVILEPSSDDYIYLIPQKYLSPIYTRVSSVPKVITNFFEYLYNERCNNDIKIIDTIYINKRLQKYLSTNLFKEFKAKNFLNKCTVEDKTIFDEIIKILGNDRAKCNYLLSNMEPVDDESYLYNRETYQIYLTRNLLVDNENIFSVKLSKYTASIFRKSMRVSAEECDRLLSKTRYEEQMETMQSIENKRKWRSNFIYNARKNASNDTQKTVNISFYKLKNALETANYFENQTLKDFFQELDNEYKYYLENSLFSCNIISNDRIKQIANNCLNSSKANTLKKTLTK